MSDKTFKVTMTIIGIMGILGMIAMITFGNPYRTKNIEKHHDKVIAGVMNEVYGKEDDVTLVYRDYRLNNDLVGEYTIKVVDGNDRIETLEVIMDAAGHVTRISRDLAL